MFGFPALKDFLERVGRFYPWMLMGQWQGQRAALLRHDVDLELEPAARLARQLQQWKIPSTFFVLVTSSHYNALSGPSRQLLREIQECGCEIGLHFDPTVYPEADAAAMQSAARREADWLGQAAGCNIASLSLHNPHSLANLDQFEGFVNAYDPRIFGPDRYLSDSCRRFRHDPEAFLRSVQEAPHPIQILLHPLHYDQVEHDYAGIFRQYFQRLREDCDAQFRAHNPTYAQEVEAGRLGL